MKHLICAVVLTFLPLGMAHAGGANYVPRVGERYLDFTLPDIRDGKPVSLADFRGKKVLLIQFASW